MVETNPANTLLDVAASGKGGVNSVRKGGDDGAFSREFEQLALGADAQHSASDNVPGNDAATEAVEAEGSDAAAESGETGKSEQTTAVNEEAGIVQGQLAADGKNLPPVAVSEDGDQASGKEESDEVSVTGEAESAGEMVQLIAQQLESKQPTIAISGEIKQNIAVPITTGANEAKGEARTEAALPGLRQGEPDLPDMTNSGKDNGQAMARRDKDNNALFTLVGNSNRGAGTFTEVLNTTSAGNVAANTPAQQPASTPPVQLSITKPPQQQGWDSEMGERVVWLARHNLQHAHIQLNPRELGPIEIKVSVQNDQAHVNFVAHHATTREAIEAAIPRLREMMAEHGLNLGQADVSQHSFGGSRHQSSISDNSSGGNGAHHGLPDDGDVDGTQTILHSSRVSSNAVDYFA